MESPSPSTPIVFPFQRFFPALHLSLPCETPLATFRRRRAPLPPPASFPFSPPPRKIALVREFPHRYGLSPFACSSNFVNRLSLNPFLTPAARKKRAGLRIQARKFLPTTSWESAPFMVSSLGGPLNEEIFEVCSKYPFPSVDPDQDSIEVFP